MHARRWLAVVVAVSLAFTLLVSVTSVVHFAYRSASLHAAAETAAALISLLAAQLMYGRFRRSLDRRDLLLTAALVLFAAANLFFSAIPAVTTFDRGAFQTWAPALSRVVAAAVFAAGAFAVSRPVHRPTAAVRRVMALCALTLLVIGTGTALAGDALPRAIEPGLSPEASSRPRIVGEPSVLALQLVVMILFAAAAVGFARAADRTRDSLMLWFAIGATLAAFARLNYFLFPSLYSEYFYAGDVLRLGFFGALLIGGTRELSVAQRELEQSAVLEERRRLAREIHDGMAQDLVFIVQEAEHLARHNGGSESAADIATAARRALDDSRGAISALVRPTDEPLADALARVAQETAGRWGSAVDAHVAVGVELPPSTREALLRIVGEAVANAARHGRARRIRVDLAECPKLELRIADDGVGFDPASLDERSGRHGISGMRERAERVGGQLRVESRPGEGTQVVVVLP
ncbi:MAG TPA: ATP-binding protein [Solirubrobacteraceae bacterium]|jgi:signal transduction histidine kinase|nr:ATP-binding protein [Solirubrobacteraceae bacterium]